MPFSNLPKTRILVVEDNLDDSELLMRQLQKAQLGDQIKVINDGRRAVEFLEGTQSEHLVAMFLDLQLPSLSGVQVLQKMRTDDRTRNLPVIVMTSSNSPDDLKRCRELGVSSYVQKPVSFTAFTKAIADTFHNPSETTRVGVVKSRES